MNKSLINSVLNTIQSDYDHDREYDTCRVEDLLAERIKQLLLF